MTTSGKGPRARTRSRLSGEKRSKFKVEPFLQEFKEGASVVIKQDPSSHGGMPHIRYKGKVGIVKGKRGSAYIVNVKLGRGIKEIIANPEHLKQIRQ